MVLPFVATALAACRDVAAPVATDAELGPQVRLATFNVRRFFDPVCDSGRCESGDYEAAPTPASFEERAEHIAAALRRLDADVVALQELESQACLDALLARTADVLPYGVLGETGGIASVDVAVLSRTPLDRVIGHRATSPLMLPDGRTTTFSRELLEVHVRSAETEAELVVFAAHFKSKANDDPARRLAEAEVAGQIINTAATSAPAALVVLAGDLNDVPGSPPLAALVVDGGLVRAADDLAVAAQATYVFEGRGQAIDHLLLAPAAAAHRVPRSARVWRDAPATGFGGSDHAALTADLRVP